MLDKGGNTQVVDGLLIIDKPKGMTSHDVVARVRRILSERSVGHLGTLDPSATGVLPLLLGRFTRLAAFFTDADKRYEGVINFGQATDSYDADGQPVGPRRAVTFSFTELQEAGARFWGNIQQTPPPFSAKKIGGIPAYKMARKKQSVELEARQVLVKEFHILDFDRDRARFKAWVGSGTYIRSLAHDLGKILGCGAHLGELRRTAVREFGIEAAHSLEEVGAAATASVDVMSDKKYYVKYTASQPGNDLHDLLLHPRLILPEFPAITAPPDALAKIRHGASVNLPFFEGTTRQTNGSATASTSGTLIRVFENQWRLVAIAKRVAGTLFHPKVVLL